MHFFLLKNFHRLE